MITAKLLAPVVPVKNVEGADMPPLAGGLEMVTFTTPAAAMSAVVIAACKLVLETKVVVRGLPFHCTTDAGTKLPPVTVMVNAAPPAIAELGVN